MNVCLFLTASTIFSCKKDIERRRYRRSCFVILFLHTLFPNFPDVSNKFSLLFSLSLSVSRPVVRRRLWPCRLYYCLIYTRTFTKPTKKKHNLWLTCCGLGLGYLSSLLSFPFPRSSAYVFWPKAYFDEYVTCKKKVMEKEHWKACLWRGYFFDNLLYFFLLGFHMHVMGRGNFVWITHFWGDWFCVVGHWWILLCVSIDSP